MMKINMPKQANFIIRTLTDHGYEAYIVGGCVRDALLHVEPKDWDITTSASPEEVKQLFSHTVDTGIEHGTVTVLLDHEPYEVTTYRVDGKYEDHRRPSEVTFTKSLKEDLLRRDFTINAMAYNDQEGLIDLYGGEKDLAKGLIRCVGVANQRFDEDALRILRALRFAARLDFTIEEETRLAMIAKKEFLRQISAERIREELTKILISDHPELLVMAYELGITKIILPEWDEMMETPQNNPHHLYSVGLHSLKGIQQIEPNVHLRYAMLLHDAGKPACKTTDDEGIDHFTKHPLKSKDIAREVLRRLKFDNETVKVVTTLVEWHDWRFMKATDINKKAVRRLANKIGVDLCYQLFKVQHADIMAQSDYQKKQKLDILEKTKSLLDEIVADQECITLKDLKLNGKDLIAMGVQPGKQIGVILNSLLDLVLEQPELNTEEALAEMAEEMRKEIC
jgi:tRNA nucleotidyltransferase (CCA-adding enzyme)